MFNYNKKIQTFDLLTRVKKQDPYVFFIISRSLNKNVVVYTLKKDKVIPYWIMYENDPSGKKVENLNRVEEKFGFGVKIIKKYLNSKGAEVGVVISLNGFLSHTINCNFLKNESTIVIEGKKILIKEIEIKCSLFIFGMVPKIEGVYIRGVTYKEKFPIEVWIKK